MTYADPRPRNFCSDLNLTSRLVDRERCLMVAPLVGGIRSKNQGCKLGVLATMVDVAGSDPVLAAWNPDWTATQDLSVNIMEPISDGPVVVDARLLKVGKKVTFVAANIYGGNGSEDLDELQSRIDGAAPEKPTLKLVGRSLVTFSRISRGVATGVDDYDPNKWLGAIRKRTSDHAIDRPLHDLIGLRVLDAPAGMVEVAKSTYVSNSIGTINGGVQAVIVEAAAEAFRPGMCATDIQLHFLAPLKIGPAQTASIVIRDARDHSVVTIKLIDAGDESRIIAVATLILQPFR